MKKNILILIALIATCMPVARAQISVHVNIGVQPIWGPVGYDYVDYYYIPDIEAYYSVTGRQYTYYDGGRWVTTYSLPPRYSSFDLYHAHKVVINEASPWMHHDKYRNEYRQYRGRHDQAVIRDSHDQRYFENPHHPEHNKWHGNDGRPDHDGDHGHGNDGHNGNRGHPGHEDHGHDHDRH